VTFSSLQTGKLKIWIYKDRNTGAQKGEATVTYDDPNAAQSAISWFDGKVSEMAHSDREKASHYAGLQRPQHQSANGHGSRAPSGRMARG